MSRLFRLSTAIVLGFALIAVLAEPSRDATLDRIWDINSDGSAKLFVQTEKSRAVLWTVSCRVQLRGCVARGGAGNLWIDSNGQAVLVFPVPATARISVGWRNQVRDVPGLNGRPLRDESILLLAQQGAHLIAEDHDAVVFREPTTGIDEVIRYLKWLLTDEARVLRDASLYPDMSVVPPEALDTEVLERYRIWQFRLESEPNFTVPTTKPQLEFATRAQGGVSFRVPGAGQSGSP